MQTRICLTCKFGGLIKVKEKPPCAPCIARSGFSKWEPIPEVKEQEESHA